MAEAALLAALAALALAVWMLFRVQRTLEEKHRQMLGDLNDGLLKQGDRLAASIGELRESVSAKLDARLDQISSKVNERLDEGSRPMTRSSTMQRLTTRSAEEDQISPARVERMSCSAAEDARRVGEVQSMVWCAIRRRRKH
jgi:DNA recombination protein RmuC